ncbi:glycosyltransferase family 4 protein [Halalkalicoccus tibetensis]|uniref:Glycosyltransferase family 4 protein n=1 Tax=Halalkalicoccus tibetensis TaxID=175632 RepID=A0ABD5V9B5_9EURY
MSNSDPRLSVLSLVTSETSFYRQQEEHLRKQGVEIDTLTVSGKEVVDGGPEETRSYSHYIKTLIEFHKDYTHSDYDVIHSNFGLTAPIALSQFRTPVVMTLWGTDLMGKYGPVTKLCAKRCDGVMVRSEEMAEMLPCNAEIVPSGVDLDLFQPMSTVDARREVGWAEEPFQVLFPYSPGYTRKNYPLAEAVVNEVSDELGMDIELQTISDIEHEKVPVYMNASDAILLTSSREGSPNTVKEAMACNVPVVTTDVGDVQLRLKNVTNSYVGRNEAELVSGLKQVLLSGERTNGREEVREVSWENIAKAIIALYQLVVK